MTSFALSLGCALLAFGPSVALFSYIVYSKAQLVIVVTSAAFAFLCSSFVAGFFWWIFYLVRLRGPLAGIIPGVLAQFAFRCMFVHLYHRVEHAIQISVQQQEQEDAQSRRQRQQQAAAAAAQNHNGEAEGDQASATATATAARNKNNWTEVAKLKLELNDASCGIAAGVGFGGMHAVMLYGTLLASEITNNVGVLYQDSCPAVPSLAVSALYAFFFSILDIFFMLFTFFGMRRRWMYHRGEGPTDPRPAIPGALLGNSREGGNMALLSALIAHFAASIFTTADYFKWGCMVSLPANGIILFFVAYWFWAGAGRIYMLPDNGTRDDNSSESRTRHSGYNQHQD